MHMYNINFLDGRTVDMSVRLGLKIIECLHRLDQGSGCNLNHVLLLLVEGLDSCVYAMLRHAILYYAMTREAVLCPSQTYRTEPASQPASKQAVDPL